ncbi:hypothetical protein AB0C10_23690 [Microbispora amethystogenes]
MDVVVFADELAKFNLFDVGVDLAHESLEPPPAADWRRVDEG